jgi:hypothetical protein
MRYITLQEAAQRLNMPEEKLLQWAKDGYLNLYASKSTKSATPSAVSKYTRNNITYQTSSKLYCRADEIEELAEDLSWSRLGLKSLARDEDEDS